MSWVDIVDPTDDERELVAGQLGLGPTVVAALRHPKERTKLQRYGDYFHVAVHDCRIQGEQFVASEVDLVMGPGWLVTVRHPGDDGGHLDLELVARLFELQRTEHDATEEGFLLWALFDVIVDRYFDVTDGFDDRLDTLEESVFGDDGQGGVPGDVFAIRRDLMEFRRAAAPLREVVTSWGAILIVATLIAGIYGMNFRHMPELHWQYGYAIALGIALGMMAASTFILYRLFKKRDWL